MAMDTVQLKRSVISDRTPPRHKACPETLAIAPLRWDRFGLASSDHSRCRLVNYRGEANMFIVENAATPKSSALDELVPSRYALTVGDIDVLVVSDGVLPLPTKMLGHNAKQIERDKWFDEMCL